MTGRDDYLFDPKATPVDPEIAALERALAPLAARPLPVPDAPAAVPIGRPRRRVWPWLAAAAVLIAAVIAFATMSDGESLRPSAGRRTFITTTAALEVPLGDLARITLRPGSELDFLHWRKDEARFALRRGALEARVAPPPAVPPTFFRMETPRGLVIDQGCRYELELRDDGSAYVVVTEGAVTFETKERTVFVPAGAATVVTDEGASTPTFLDAPPELAKAVHEFDEVRRAVGPIDARYMTMKMVLAAARSPRDSLVLWHVLRTDPDPELRKVAEGELFRLTPGPDSKTKSGSLDAEDWLAYLRLEVWR